MARDSYEPVWLPQSQERLDAIDRRANALLWTMREQHFARLVRQWAAKDDDGPLPTLAMARQAAEHELEVLCRGLGRLGALEPREVFPAAGFTTPLEEEGW